MVVYTWGDSMQSKRLFKIIYILLERKKVTATGLSKELEVSVRTIYRDIEKLSMAGIPLFTDNGRYGGISILDNFVLNKSLLTEKDQLEILIGLQSLSATQYPGSDDILKRIAALFHKSDYNWIKVDFSRWGIDVNKQKNLFNQLKMSILNKEVISFDYFNSHGELSRRSIDPIKLMYKGKHWYLYGFCHLKNDFRLFKITRIKNLALTERTYDKPYCHLAIIEPDIGTFNPLVDLELVFIKRVAHRVYDTFDESVVRQTKDGKLKVNISVPEDEWLYEFLMSFGENVYILSPQRIAGELKERYKKALKNFES